MGLDLSVRTLANCTKALGRGQDAADTLDEGFLLFHNVSSDPKLCDKVTEKLTGFGDVLTVAKDAYKEASSLIKSHSAAHLKGLTPVKERLEEWSVAPVVTELRSFSASLLAMNAKLEAAELALGRLEGCSRCLHVECAKHGRSKTRAGGLFIASGCLALTLSAATFLIKCAVQTTRSTLSPAASVIFRFSPLNMAVAGGFVTALGVSDTRHSHRYSKLTLDFRDFADDLQREIASSRSFRTRIQRLRHAVDDMALSLHVNTAVAKIEGTTWNLLLEWLPLQEQALRTLTGLT